MKNELTKNKYAMACLPSTSFQIPWDFPDFLNKLIPCLFHVFQVGGNPDGKIGYKWIKTKYYLNQNIRGIIF